MARILGVNPAPNHDTSACVVVNGKLVAAAEEERFNKQKHTRDMPFLSMKFCLDFAGLKMEDIDYIAIPWAPNKIWHRYFTLMIKNPSIYTVANFAGNLPFPFKYRHKYILGRKYEHLPEICYIPHHFSHACTAFFPSNSRSSSVLTVDAVGENDSTVAWNAEGRQIQKIREESYSNSLGEIYSAFTEYLGFKPYSDEGKTMGLAPYGKERRNITDSVKKMIDADKGKWYKVDPAVYLLPDDRKDLNRLSTLLGRSTRRLESPLDWTYPDVAYAVQSALEKALIKTVKDIISVTGKNELCLSGGVALNCKANGVVRDNVQLTKFFAFPAANDAGTSIGAALALAASLGDDPRFDMQHASYGPEFSDAQIEQTLDQRSLTYEYHKDIAGECAELLSRGKIIGWFQGRMELGARALGNRSILADPRDAKMKDKVNIRVKKREPWRPFCPSMLFEAMNEYLVNPCEAPFMIIGFQVPPNKVSEIPAVVHVDASTRPQTVKREISPLYWDLISKFEDETGIPMLLNTSFNLAGEPIVCTPSDAIRAFFDSGMDCLALGRYLLKK